MEQLTQKLGSGEMVIQELPVPQLGPGMIMVKNHYSLISAGTEGSTVKAARKSLIGKAKERPQQVQQVLTKLKQQGIVQTYRAVMKKLDAYSPLGYSSAGEVVAVADDVDGFRVGDKVACAGAGYANHAEIVCVPVNLCVRLAPDADLAFACYNTLGAIAMQGVRQADLRLGETCAVIGLGLIGQLACLELRASGVNVIGIDVSAAAVATAAEHCCDVAMTRDTPGIEERILEYTDNRGADCVIIAAATSSLDPVNFAGAISRRKGRIVVLGAVPTGFDREPYFYKKELELRMSCSYGPGRYDLNYEEKGIDYPAAYVRWTEKRNMQAFQHLVHTGRIDIAYLTTHVFAFEEAPRAYDIVVRHSEPFMGILLKYDTTHEHKAATTIAVGASTRPADGAPGIAFIGAGSYAQGNLLPNLPAPSAAPRVAVLTGSGTTSKRVAEKFGFARCTSDEADILGDPAVNTVFIATRHDTHARYVADALRAGKNVYVEKPLCLTLDELADIERLTASTGKGVMIGFNRRFSPFARMLKKHLGSGRMSMLYRVNAGSIEPSHWIQDPQVGGGRIVGEACHFIDLMAYMCGSVPVKVAASAIPDASGLNDTVNITVEFANGSTGVVAYYANGPKSLPKEYFEAYHAGMAGIIHDFRRAEVYGRKVESMKRANQDKGQPEMMRRFFESLAEGSLPITMQEVFSVTKATFAALESIRENGMPILIN